MESPELASLSLEKRGKVTQLREITANARDVQGSIALLESCGWDLNQAMELHWAAGDDLGANHANPNPTGRGGDLGMPLLGGGEQERRADPMLDGRRVTYEEMSAEYRRQGQQLNDAQMREHWNNLASGQAVSAPSQQSAPAPPAGGVRRGVIGWISGVIRSVAREILDVLSLILFGGARVGPSGTAFRASLANSMGSNANGVVLPRFYEGTFANAITTARRDLKLLVVYLHSENARWTQNFCMQVLGNDAVRQLLDENFLLWGGDVLRRESHQVAQLIHARQYPCFTALLPVSVDEIRVIGMVAGQVEPDAAIGLLAQCMEEMEGYRAELIARQVQHQEDRHLRQEQDQEYQEALARDREQEEQRQKEAAEREAVDRVEREAAEAKAKKEAAKEERKRNLLNESEVLRKKLCAELGAEAPDYTARVSLRLPAGQRVQRKFKPTATLEEVYNWANCVGYLPENAGKGLVVPYRFKLKTTFPSRELTEREKTIEELQLSGSNIVLESLDDSDED